MISQREATKTTLSIHGLVTPKEEMPLSCSTTKRVSRELQMEKVILRFTWLP